jgi:hypothetical protein
MFIVIFSLIHEVAACGWDCPNSTDILGQIVFDRTLKSSSLRKVPLLYIVLTSGFGGTVHILA